MWNAVTNNDCDAILNGHHRCEVNVIVSLSNGKIASGSNHNSVRVWNIVSRTCEAIVTCIAPLPNNRMTVLSGSCDSTLRVFRTSYYQENARRFSRATYSSRIASVSCSSSSIQRIVSAGSWDAIITSGECVVLLSGHHVGSISAVR